MLKYSVLEEVHVTTIGTLEKAAILTAARAQESSHDCDVAINSDALIQTYLLLAIDLLRSRAFEREVRLYKGEARASESSTCFPCRESHQVTSFWRELLRMLHAALPVKLSKYFSHLVTGFVRVMEI